MQYVSYIAKAIAAVLAVVLGAAAGGALGLEPWAITLIEAILAGLAVFQVKNGPAPE